MLKFGSPHEHRAAGAAGVDPHVERVGGFGDGGGAGPVGGLHERPQFGGGFLEPHVGAVLLDECGDGADDARVEERIAGRVVERRDRYAPRALARDAPVGAGFHRAFDAVLAPVGNPEDAVDLGEGGLAKSFPLTLVVDLDEPLIHRAEDHGRLAAPAVRVAVVVILLMQQGGAHAEFVEDGVVGIALAVLFEDRFADHFSGQLLVARQVIGRRETAVVIDGRVDGQADLAAELIVLHAVAGGDVNEARARAVLDKARGEKASRARAEGMLVNQRRELLGAGGADDLVTAPAALFGNRLQQRIADQIRRVVGLHVGVEKVRVEGDREIRGQGPRRGGPDDDVGVRLALQAVAHIHALAHVIGVFDLRLGQRGAARDAPIHGLFPAIDEALLDEVREQAQFVGLVFFVQREVGIFPIAQHAEALELRALDVDVFARVSLARGADGRGIGGGVAGLAHLLADLEFDGQPVAVPARDVGRIKPAQGFVFDDDVLEDLVERGADVDIAIRKRGAVVQHKFLRPAACRANGVVEAGGLPFLESSRLVQDEVRPHREVGFGQVECVFIVHRSSG